MPSIAISTIATPLRSLLRDEAGDREFLLGVALVAGDEIVFLGERIGVHERRTAVVAADNTAKFEGIEGAAHGGQ